MRLVAGIDLGGTAINYSLLDEQGRFLIETLCEHPSASREGPQACLAQITAGLDLALARAGARRPDLAAAGLDTPGPASGDGVLSTHGSTNFAHPGWSGYDIRGNLEQQLGIPVAYLNDGNAAALWGHASIFGADSRASSVAAVIGTGLGGGVIAGGALVTGCHGFGGELGHVLLPYREIPGLGAIPPRCNCGRIGDLESVCSLTAIENTLLPAMLSRHPGHELARAGSLHQAAKLVRGRAESGDEACREIFRIQARALGLFFDQMINIFDPDALIVGGGALETAAAFQEWFLAEIRSALGTRWDEQMGVQLCVMPNGDTAGARGAAVAALQAAGWAEAGTALAGARPARG